MKKILIVGDVNSYAIATRILELKDYDPIFCSNRKSAEDYLSKVQAIITDRDIDYSRKQVFADVLTPAEDGSVLFKKAGLLYRQEEIKSVQAYYLMLRARSFGKPAIMIAQRKGEIGFGKVEEYFDQSSLNAYLSISQNDCEEYSELLSRVENDPTPEDYFQLFLYAKYYGVKIDWMPKDGFFEDRHPVKILKTAFNELRKQL